ncbi:MAG: DUF3372 domain-containing protein [Aquabacterium sp.]|nr:DUF3372 domain-containing protein [Aquabacterium sp.]
MPDLPLPNRRLAAAAAGRPRAGWRWWRGWAGAAITAMAAGAAAQPPDNSPQALREACDAAAHFKLLHADGARHEARAVWLDGTRLVWPGAPAAGADHRYRLVQAAAGGLQVSAGAPVAGAEAAFALQAPTTPWPATLTERFRHVAAGAPLQLPETDAARLRALHRGQLLLVREDAAGRVQQATAVQHAGALDDLYAAAEALPDLGVSVTPAAAPAPATTFHLWAPTAQAVWLCRYADDRAAALPEVPALQRDEAPGDQATGTWRLRLPGDFSGQYYNYLVDVWVPGTGLVRQRVTDPYATSLGADSRRTWIGRLDAPATLPAGWASAPRPRPLLHNTDLAVYELHVRDFSIGDTSVSAAQRGKYAAFVQPRSRGMRHLAALARAGLTDVHLLPVFDFASVPEVGCVTPSVPAAAPDSPAQQAAVMAVAAQDCFNWGYDPLHFNAPEGSYASRPDDGAVRIREFRQMVMALHRTGLRVGMDVVYNHLSASGQHPQSVLDRIVPGYYHRLDAAGQIERSTCCDNSATEHRMMAKLMRDSVRLWAREYRIDSFRFDLMGHQPRAAMEQLRDLLKRDNGRPIHLLGEGWNFGEVANGARFVQASQLSLNGSDIATFSDRARDALRGGGVGDGPAALVARQGYLNGLAYAPNDAARALVAPDRDALKAAADLVRLGLAGTLRGYAMDTRSGERRRGEQMVYAGQIAGYASQPGEVVNYVENHDNHTLWDLNAFKLPLATSSAERARVQVLGMAFTALSQGVAYFHAGIDVLRSKSMDGNSYDSGDWFNRLDWTYTGNHFGSGLPPAPDNAALHALIAPRLADARLRAQPADIAFARDAMRDLLRIRASSRLFHLTTADAVQRRLSFHNTGPQQNPVLIAAELDGRGLPGAGFARVMVLVNVDTRAHPLTIAGTRGQRWALHPVHRAAAAADRRAATQARFEPAQGRFSVPARTAVVYVLR